MLMHYLYVAIRNARRGPLAFVMNVLTLAVGLACFVTVYGFVDFWRSADRHFANADRIYVVRMEFEARDGSFAMGSYGGPEPLAQYLRADFPGIERVVSAVPLGQDAMASSGDRTLRLNAYAAAAEFFELFRLATIPGLLHRADPADAAAVPARARGDGRDRLPSRSRPDGARGAHPSGRGPTVRMRAPVRSTGSARRGRPSRPETRPDR